MAKFAINYLIIRVDGKEQRYYGLHLDVPQKRHVIDGAVNSVIHVARLKGLPLWV